MFRAALFLALLACVAISMAVAAEGMGGSPQDGRVGAEAGALSPLERAEILKGKIVLRELPNPGRQGRTYEAVGVLPGRKAMAW